MVQIKRDWFDTEFGNYERGKSYPDIPVLRKIEELYGVPYNRLIFLPLDYDKTVNRM